MSEVHNNMIHREESRPCPTSHANARDLYAGPQAAGDVSTLQFTQQHTVSFWLFTVTPTSQKKHMERHPSHLAPPLFELLVLSAAAVQPLPERRRLSPGSVGMEGDLPGRSELGV